MMLENGKDRRLDRLGQETITFQSVNSRSFQAFSLTSITFLLAFPFPDCRVFYVKIFYVFIFWKSFLYPFKLCKYIVM